MARTVYENPSCPDGRALAQAQRDTAESEHSTFREKKRKLQSDALPPLPVYNRAVLEAHRAEKVGRVHMDQLDTGLALEGRKKHALETQLRCCERKMVWMVSHA
ncbi:hypothetical protein PHYPSEUDO_003162 [Phytophthora pseudosyringae]|uniref:Uncharacterized protein n=1 Tax=Phytophthora pseudosyringae TaxID=221518 RepID=A0A8T1VVJ3_9STRA|nr:hypothetical protein PHYPSEUDO_003162 [Phytophthora pseudosyringae]